MDVPARLSRMPRMSARALLPRFSPGEHVAIWAANCPEWALIEFGAALAGVTLVTVNPAYLANELAFVLKQSHASGIFVQARYRDRDLMAVVEQVRSELPQLREVIPLSPWQDLLRSASSATVLPTVAPDDIAQIQYTSGTTGFPKGARLTHRGLGNNGRFFARTVGRGMRRCLDQSDADVSYRRLRIGHPWRAANRWRAGDAAGLRSRADASTVRGRAWHHHGRRADHDDPDAERSRPDPAQCRVLAPRADGRRAGAARTGAPCGATVPG